MSSSTLSVSSSPRGDWLEALEYVLDAKSLDDLVRRVYSRLIQCIQVTHGGWYVVDPSHGEIIWENRNERRGSSERTSHPIGLCTIGTIATSKRVRLFDDIRSSESFFPDVDLGFMPASYRDKCGRVRAMLLPLIDPVSGSVLMIFQLLRASGSSSSSSVIPLPDFTESDESAATMFLRSVAKVYRQLSVYDSHEQILERAKTSQNRSQVILEFASDIATELSVSGVVNRIMDKARSLLMSERSSVFLVDEKAQELFTTYCVGVSSLRIPLTTTTIATESIRTRSVLNIPDCYADSRFNSEMDDTTGFHSRSILCIPIQKQDSIIGVIQFINRFDGKPFDEKDEEFGLVISGFCGVALSNALLHSEAVRQKNERQAIMEFAQLISRQLDVDYVLRRMSETSRSLVNADRCAVFLVDYDTNMVVSKVVEGASDIRVPLGKGIAGYVAKTGETINIPDCYQDSRFNPEVDMQTGYHTRSMLCMPIRDGERIVGVAQLINKINYEQFDEDDEEVFSAFSTFCGIAIRNSLHYNEMVLAQQRFRTLLDLALILSSDNLSSLQSDELMKEIMRHACALLEADRFSVFSVDRKHNELVTNLGDEFGEIRVPLFSGIVGHVAATGREAVVSDVTENPHFNPEVDKKTGYKTKSIVAVPIVDPSSHETVAVAELVNKQSGKGFSPEDVDLLRAFATFCGRSSRSQDACSVFSLPVQRMREVYYVDPDIRERLNQWDFSHFSLSENELVGLVVAMFESLDLLDIFSISYERFYSFVLEVKRHYNDYVIYHNFRHAFDVTQAMYYYILHSHSLETEFLRPMDVLSLMVAALCHDINHQGFTNAFMQKAETAFGLLYSSGAVMETHHASIAISILSNPEFNILSTLELQDSKEVWRTIIFVILATEMSRDREFSQKFSEIFSTGQFNPRDEREHRLLFMAMLMKWSDLSSCTRPFEIAKQWGERVMDEFFAQGDTEKSRGLPLTPMFDRESVRFASTQLGFTEHVALPTFTLMSKVLPDLSNILESLQMNIEHWRALEEDED